MARLLKTGDAIYGVNTGFGKLAKTRIAAEDLSTLQINIVRSHAAGVGAPLDENVVRLMMLLKINALSQGASGISLAAMETLVALLNADVLPVIPGQGSVGASGDLAPLAHLSLVLIGEGEVLHKGKRLSGAKGLAAAGVGPVALGPKEGLALLNGTQVSTALALSGLIAAERNAAAAILAGALSIDAVMGSDTPFDPRIHALRPHPGQVLAAAHYRRLLAGSAIRASHLVDDERVQDPYSFRCQPQVMGACLDMLANAARTLDDRGQWGFRQSAGVCRGRRGAFRRQFPCGAGGLCGRHDCHCHCGNGLAFGTAHRGADRFLAFRCCRPFSSAIRGSIRAS